MVRALADWSVHNRVAANILMLVLLLGGLISLTSMHRETFPVFSLDTVMISVSYPGASPEEIEEGICIKIEEKIHGIEGVRDVRSQASEGLGVVFVELRAEARDPRRVLDEIKSEVDRIDTFPEDAERPVVTELLLRDPAIRVAVFGNVTEDLLRSSAERVQDELLSLPEISQVNLMAAREREISIEISEPSLRAYGLTLDGVAEAIRRASLDLPGGSIKTPQGEVVLRAKGQRYDAHEFEEIPVITLENGTIVRLGHIASVIEGFEDVDVFGRYQGKPAITVAVMKTETEDLLKIVDAVRAYKDHKNHTMPPGVELGLYADFSDLVRDRIAMLAKNGLLGFALVCLTLWLFLQMRLAVWVAMGIPVSLMGGMIFMNWTGQTINMISLFALIMALGIVVDDAIVVGENVYRHRTMGKSPVAAAVEGTREVGPPVIMTILTSVVAFAPMLFVTGIMGKFFRILPIAVIVVLLISLVQALMILPSHLAFSMERGKEGMSPGRRTRARIDAAIQAVVDRFYAPLLKKALVNRYFCAAVAVAVLLSSFGLVTGGRVPFLLFPSTDSDWLVAQVVFPQGTVVEHTEKAVRHIEQACFKLNHEFSPGAAPEDRVVQRIFSSIGEIAMLDFVASDRGGHCAEIFVELLPSERRKGNPTAERLRGRWRELVGEIPGTEKLLFLVPEGGPPGSPIEVELSGNDLEQLKKAADAFKERIARFSGTYDIVDDFSPGKMELRVEARAEAYPLGVNQFDLARRVRASYFGAEAVRVQRGRDDVRVMVRYTPEERRTLDSLDDLRILTPGGAEIPFSEIASLSFERGYSDIRRRNRTRVINVTSDLDEATANARQIIETLRRDFVPHIESKFPGVRVGFEGQEQQTRESVQGLMRGLVYAMIVCFALLAVQFRSYIQPVIIMAAIPFGFIGALIGHMLFRFDITLISLFGIVALSGIVINGSILLISFINDRRRAGAGIFEAAYESGCLRFRPIMLTTLTTVAGLLPLILERSLQAQYLVPMAISISAGLVFGTLLILLIIPSFYLIVEDAAGFLGIKSTEGLHEGPGISG